MTGVKVLVATVVVSSALLGASLVAVHVLHAPRWVSFTLAGAQSAIFVAYLIGAVVMTWLRTRRAAANEGADR